MAYDLQLYYEGYPDDLIPRVHDKMKFERERMCNLTDSNFVDTFDKFIDYADEEDRAGLSPATIA